MRKLLAGVAVLAQAGSAAAEESYDQLQLDLGLSVIAVAYERAVTDHVALQLEGGIFSTYFAPWFDVGDKVMGFSGGLRASYFLRADRRGPYLAPFARVGRGTAERDELEGTAVGVTAGVFAGWAFGLTDKLDVRIGGGVKYMHYETDVGGETLGLSTPFVAIDAVVGYRL
ncbi:MAG: hypothetical protein WKG01_04245 [Kofleriaceae bacterium]